MFPITTAWLTMTLVLFTGCNRAPSSKQVEPALSKQVEAGSSVNEAKNAKGPEVPNAQSTTSDYAPIPLDRLIGTAELIVMGEVLAVKDGTIAARGKSILAGSVPSPAIEIQQYIPSRFEGAPRPAAYQPGQTFLWFLVKDQKQPRRTAWTIMGAGGEGEMPVEDNFIYFPGRHVEGLGAESHRVQGAQRSLERYEAAVFLEAVKKYRGCFTWKSTGARRPEPIATCNQADLDQLSQTSSMQKYLVEITLNRLKHN